MRILAIVAVLLLSGCAIQPALTTAVPDVVGLAGDEALAEITEAELTVTWDAGEDFVVLAGNWTVDAQFPAAGTEIGPGSDVTLTVTRTVAEDDEPASSDRADVPWADYDGSVKTRIDQLEAAADCAGLQIEFDTADGNSAATQNRTGHSNADLMQYIDEAMRLADCY